MGGCLTTQQQSDTTNPANGMSAQAHPSNADVQPGSAFEQAHTEAAQAPQAEASTTDAHSTVSSEAPHAVTRPAPEVSMDSLGEVGSPLDQGVDSARSPNPNAVLTESALRQLNQTGSFGKKGRPSSTGTQLPPFRCDCPDCVSLH